MKKVKIEASTVSNPSTERDMSDSDSDNGYDTHTYDDAGDVNDNTPSGPNFRGQDLRQYDFQTPFNQGVNFVKADFSGADLRGVVFPENVNMTRSRFDGADLRGASFVGVDISLAVLDGADLRGSNMICTDLCCASLRGVNAQGVNFSGAILCAVNAEGSNFSGCDFDGADMRDGTFPGCMMRGCNWNEAIIKDSCTCGSDLSGAAGTPAEDPPDDPEKPEVFQRQHSSSTHASFFGQQKNDYNEH